MVQFSNSIEIEVANHSEAMESRDHFKNGSISKSQKSRITLLSYVLVVVFAISATFMSCNKDNDGAEPKGNRENYRVCKIYNYANILMFEYFYDNDNRLIKRAMIENLGDRRQEWAGATQELEYINGRVSKMIHTDVTYNMFKSEVYFFYDSQNRLIRTETHINDSGWEGLWAHSTFHYENGKVVRIDYVNEESPALSNTKFDNFVYDQSMNLTQFDNTFPEVDVMGRPKGQYGVRAQRFNFDNGVKPYFGIDYLFSFNPLPVGDGEMWVNGLSKNNMTEDVVGTGTTWTYTYNEHGLPSTIETKWKDIETIDPDTGEPFPMLLKIEYRQVK